MNESTKWLYEKLSSHGYNVGASAEIFDSLMVNNPESRKWAYNTAQKHGYNVGEYDMFERLVGAMTDGVETTESGSVVVSPAEAKENADSINQFMENRDTLYSGPRDYNTGIISGAEQRRIDSVASEMEAQAEAARQRLQEDGTIDRMKEAKKEARREKLRAFGRMLGSTPQVSSFGVSTNVFDSTDEQLSDVGQALDAGTDYRQNKLLQEKLDVALDMARAGENQDGLRGVENFGLGLWDSATRLSTWDFGASDIVNNLTLQQIVEKWENDPSSLTATEQKVLEGIGMATAVQELYSDQVGIGYNVGQSLPESAGFMASMALNPASGLGKSLARNAVRTYGRNSIRKNLARIGGDIAETAIMTATTGAGRVAADALERINGSSTYEIGENGVIMYGGQKDQETVGNAVIKAIGANFIENYSEALGEYFDPLLGMSRKVAAGGLRKMNLNKWADALSDVQPSQMTASIRALREKTKFGGIFGEVMEEEIGMALNAISGVGDYTFSREKAEKEGKQWIFDLENQLTTVLSCAIMSGTLNGVEQVSSVAARRRMEKNAKNAEQEASYRFPRDEFAPLREAIDQASPEGMVDVLRDVYMSQEYTVGQKRALAEYAAARLQLQYYNAADAKARRQVNKTQQELLDAQEAGLNAQLPQFFNIARAAQFAEDELLDYDGDWNLVDIIRSSMNKPEEMGRILGDLPPREAQLVTNYIYSRARMEGAYQGRSNRAEDYIDDFAYALEPAVVTDAEGNRTITTALLGDRSVYVLENNGDLAHIMRPDGSKTLVKASELTNITTSPAEEVIDRYRDMYTFEYNAETENAFEHHPKTQAPQVGLQLQSPEGEVVITAVNDNMVEIVPAVYKDGQVQPKEGAEPRTITVDDAYAWQDSYYQGLDDAAAATTSQPTVDNMSAETAENEGTPSEQIEQSVSEEVTDGQNAETQPTETESVAPIAPAAPQTARERVPKDDKGNPIYEQTDADTAWDAIVEETEGDTEMAQRVAADMLADKKAALAKLQNGKPKKGATVAEKIANEKAHAAAIAQAQNDVAQWEAIVGTEARRREATMSEADRYAAEMEEKNINEGLAALGEPQSLEEYVLGQLAGGSYKLRWSDKENGTKGFGSHTGLSTEEMKARLSMIDNKNGLTPEEIAHSIVKNMDASFGEVDVMDVTNMVIDAVSTHASRRSMLNGMVESRTELLRQQEIAEQEAKDAWYMEQYHATEEELAAYNEYLAEFAEEIYGEDTDYEQRIATFAEIQLEYDNQGTDAGLRSSADQGERLASDREGSSSVGETEQLDRRELREDAEGVAEAEDGRAGSSISAESDAERIGAVKAELGVFGADNAAEYANRLYGIYQWKSLEEANEVLRAVLRSYDRLSGQTLGVLPYLDQAQKLIKGSLSEEEVKENMRRTLLDIGYTEEEIAAAERDQQRYEADMAEDAVETVETLENGDVRRTNRNSNGEIATVVIERDGNVISVDTYEDGALFERTDYDANGNATKVTRYKDGEVVSEQEYKDGKRKVTANVFEMAEDAQKKRKSKKKKNDKLAEKNHQQKENRSEARGVRNRLQLQDDQRYESFIGRLKRLIIGYKGTTPTEEVAKIIRDFNNGKTLLARTEQERELLKMLRVMTNQDIDYVLSEIEDVLSSDAINEDDRKKYEDAVSLINKFKNRGERKAIIRGLTGAELGDKLPLTKIDELFEMYNSDADVSELYGRVRVIAEQIGLDFWFDDNMDDEQTGGYLDVDNRVRLNAHMLYSPYVTQQEKASAIVHEILHAVADYAIKTQKDIKLGLKPSVQLSKQVLNAANSILNIYEKVVKNNPLLVHEEYDPVEDAMKVVPDYGTSSAREMLSEISNPDFRDKLKQIKYKNRSVWQWLWDAIKSMFGKSSDVTNPTAYDSMAKALDVLINEFSVDAYQKYSGLEESAMKLSADDNLRFREKEEQKELIAVHNISEDNLRKVLEVGSLIMPSIAITKADIGHTGFGDISLLFDKSTINPSDRRNKVYGGDAWTPRFPRIGVKLNEKVVSRINKKAYELIEDRRLREIFSLSSEVYPDNIEKVISYYGVEGYYNKEWMKLAYLLDSGKRVKIPTKAKDYGIASEDIVRLAKEKGISVKDIYEDYDFYKNNPDFVAQVKEARDEARLSSIPEEQRDEMRERMQSRPLSEAAFYLYIRGALGMENDLANGGLKEVVDRQALRDLIEKKVRTDNAEYNKWVDNLFEGIVEKRGIRNNRDWYTPSGSLRPWGQLYDPATPANILKYMLAENEQGGSGGFFDSNIMAASAETYDSIEEIREKGKKRLKQLPYEEYDEWSNSIADRMAKICDDFLSPSQKNSMGGAIDAKIEITNAVAKDKTAKSIYKHMHREYPNFTMEHAKQVEEIVKEIQEFATDYFEAKPQRIVSVNEVMAAVVPSNASKEIVDALKNNGIEVVTYKKGDEEARKRVVKRVSSSLDIKFREGEGAISDREVSYENDPIAKFMGKPRYYGKRAAAFAERERRRMENAAKEAAEMLGIEAEIVTDASTLQGRKAKAKGWYDIVNKKVVVVVPNHVSMGDAVRTVLHEGIAHHGLRELFGDGFDAMLDNVYNNVSPELKARIDAIAERTGVSTSVATEEYMASLAETTNFEEAQRRGWWQQIKSYFVDMLRKLAMPGLKLKEEITDNELRYLLWRNYKNLVEPNSYLKPLGYAEDVVKQKELKVGEYAEKAPATPMAADTSEAEEWAAVTMQRIEELEAQAAQLENEIAEMEADRDADDASRYEMWEQQLEPLRKQMEDVYAELEGLYSLEAEAEEMSMASEDAIRYRLVDDPAEIERLESEPTIKAYRAMQVINGELYPPMSAVVDGKLREPIALGQWEQSEERPDLADDKGRFKLDKGNKKSLKAAYNPYFHSSSTPLNDQFSEAQDRDNLVTVEVEIPVSEADGTSEYKAEKAKDAVGTHQWKAGIIQGQLTGTREVFLTRWDKPMRIVPDSEVADVIVDMFDGKNIVMPSNVVTPQLRKELEARGITFVETDNQGKLVEGENKGKHYSKVYGKKADGLRYREGDDTKLMDALADAYASGDAAAIQDAVNDIMNAIRLDDADPSIGNFDWEKVENYNGTDPRLLAAQYIVRAQHHLYLDEDYDTEYIKTGIKTVDAPFNETAEEDVSSYTNDLKNEQKEAQRQFEERVERSQNSSAKGVWLWNGLMSVEEIQERHKSLIDEFENLLSTHQFDKAADKLGEIRAWQNAAKRHIDNTYSETPYVGEDILIADIERESAALGVPVRIARSVDELPDDTETRKRAEDGSLKGVYSTRGGEVVVYLPNTENANDAKRTILHEIVGHKGLRQLIGEQRYDKAMLQLMYMLPADVRDAVLRRAERHGWNAAIAMDEYLAEQAERDVQPTWWGKVNAKIRALLRNLGFDVKLTDADVTYLLWRSRKKLQGDDLNDMAVNAILKQAARKSAEADTWNEQAFRDAEMRDFERNTLPSVRHRMGADTNDYEKAVRTLGFKQAESWQDSMRSLLVFQRALAKASGKDISDFENAYMYENRMSSANLMEMEQYRHMVYNPLLKAIHELEQMGASRESIINYLFAKSGLERNEVFARRDAKKHTEGDATKEQQLYDKYRQKDYAGLTALTRGDTQIAALVDDHSKKKTEYDRLEQNKKRGVAVSDADLKATKKEMDDARKAMITSIEAEAQRMVDEFEAQNNTDNLWDKIRNCTHTTLNISHDAGVMSDEVYNELWNQFQYYIPLRGFAETTAEDMYLYLGGNDSPYNAPIKTAYGRTSLADDPIAIIGNMAESAIVEANRNRLKQRFLYMVERHNTDLASISDVWLEYDEVNDEWHTVFAQIPDDATPSEAKRLQQEFEDRMKTLAEQNPGKYANASQQPNIPYRVVKKGDKQEHHVIVKRNGKDVVITINGNPRVAQAINGLTNPEQNNGPVQRIVNWVNRNLSDNFTMRNPAFMVSNFVRDGFYTNSMVWVKENPTYARQYNKNWAICTAQIASLVKRYKRYEKGDTSALDMNNDMDRMFYEFMINGGETGYTVIKSVEDYKGLISGEMKKMEAGAMGTARRVADTIGNVVDTFGRWAEDTSRFAAYMTSRQLGRTITKSIWDAKEISVNFNKKGSGNRMMGKFEQGNRLNYVLSNMSQLGRNLYVFWNAGMQGLNNFKNAAKKSPAKFTAMAGTYFTLGVIVAAAFSGDDDEDDYYNLPEYVRRNNICFKIGKGKYATLPLPIEIRAIYGLGELAYSYLSGREGLTHGEAVTKTIQQITQVLPIDMMADGGGAMALVPSAAKPVVEVIHNVDWTGRPIYKEKTPWNQNDPTWTLAFKSTSPELVQMSRLVNEWTNKNTADGLERPYNRGWADNRYLNNPAVWEHIMEGYLGGMATMFNQTKKTLMMPFNEDLREVRNVPIASRFIKDAGKEGRSYAARNEYYDAKNIMDSWKNEMSKAKKEVLDESLTDEQRLKAAKLRSSLEQQYTEAAERWKVLDRQRKALEEAYKSDQSEDNRQALDDVMMQMATLVEAYRD